MELSDPQWMFLNRAMLETSGGRALLFDGEGCWFDGNASGTNMPAGPGFSTSPGSDSLSHHFVTVRRHVVGSDHQMLIWNHGSLFAGMWGDAIGALRAPACHFAPVRASRVALCVCRAAGCRFPDRLSLFCWEPCHRQTQCKHRLHVQMYTTVCRALGAAYSLNWCELLVKIAFLTKYANQCFFIRFNFHSIYRPLSSWFILASVLLFPAFSFFLIFIKPLALDLSSTPYDSSVAPMDGNGLPYTLLSWSPLCAGLIFYEGLL